MVGCGQTGELTYDNPEGGSTVTDVDTIGASEGARLMIEGEYLIFGRFAWRVRDSDYELEVTALMGETQRGKRFVQRGVDGYARLCDLPQLREMQEEHKLLDVNRLAAIDNTLMLLPPDTPADTWRSIDAALVAMFTLTRSGQSLPGPAAITRRLQKLIATIDASVNFDRAKRRRREAGAAEPSVEFWPADAAGNLAGMTLIADTTTMACISAAVTEASEAQKATLAETVLALLTGRTSPSAAPVLNIFSPKGGGLSSYLPGFGWTGAEGSAALEDLLRSCPPDIVDLDEVSESHVAGYSPTPKMTAYVRARDGTCIYPGCGRPAEKSQLDHRIPYGDGGPTTPGNLHALCQRHHNVKTDRRAFYIPDPYTGETVWLFSDGTWQLSEPDGILARYTTPTAPRWSTTLSSSRKNRARAARFNAACHAVCDTFETDGDLDACLQEIAELEEEYGMRFEFAPKGSAGQQPTPTKMA